MREGRGRGGEWEEGGRGGGGGEEGGGRGGEGQRRVSCSMSRYRVIFALGDEN